MRIRIHNSQTEKLSQAIKDEWQEAIGMPEIKKVIKKQQNSGMCFVRSMGNPIALKALSGK